MKNIQLFLVALICSLISGCLAVDPLSDNSDELKPSHGVFALTLHTVEKINHLFISGMAGGKDFVVKWPPVGENIFLYELPEGQYCLREAHIGSYTVTFKDGYDSNGFCFFVEAGRLNYSGHIFLRTTSSRRDLYPRFTKLLNEKFPKICRKYIGDSCDD